MLHTKSQFTKKRYAIAIVFVVSIMVAIFTGVLNQGLSSYKEPVNSQLISVEVVYITDEVDTLVYHSVLPPTPKNLWLEGRILAIKYPVSEAEKQYLSVFQDEDYVPTFGDLFSLDDFIGNCECGGFLDSDGDGVYATSTRASDIHIYPSDVPDNVRTDFSHVVWFNK